MSGSLRAFGFESLVNQFLIAMPNLADPNFHQTVTYVCAHNREGAMGLVINRPLDIVLGDVLSQLDMDAANEEIGNSLVYRGGPVQTERGFVLHRPGDKWESSIQISDDVEVTASRDILRAIAKNEGPPQSLVALGYAGWGEGQLERELIENVWLNIPCSQADQADLIFDIPAENRWQSAAGLIGVDMNQLSIDVGHA